MKYEMTMTESLSYLTEDNDSIIGSDTMCVQLLKDGIDRLSEVLGEGRRRGRLLHLHDALAYGAALRDHAGRRTATLQYVPVVAHVGSEVRPTLCHINNNLFTHNIV